MGLPTDPVARHDQLIAALTTWASLAWMMLSQLRRVGFGDEAAYDLTRDWMHILVADASDRWMETGGDE